MSTTSPDTQRVDAFAEWIRANPDDVADNVFRACVSAVPSFITTGREIELAFRAVCSSFVPVVSEAVTTGEIPQGASLPAAADDLARRLPAAGIKLVDLALSYDIAGNALLDTFSRALRGDPSTPAGCDRADMLLVVAGRLFRFRQAALAQAMTVYHQEQQRLQHSGVPDVLAAVQRVLSGELGDAEAEQQLGYRMNKRHVAFVVWGPGATEAALREVAARLRFQMRAQQDLMVPADEHALHGWFDVPESAPGVDLLRARLSVPAGIRISLGTPQYGSSGFRVTHREALETQSLADSAMPQSIRPGTKAEAGHIVSICDVFALVFASRDIELARHFVRSQLGSLVEPRHSVLRETLRIWFEELGSPTRAARRLNVHVNTLVKRLNRASDIVARPVDAGDFALRLAFELCGITHAGGTSGPAEDGL
ncbi:helix-turn-helix domain-containing protein [Streptomyces sp. NPDC002793]|uniref:PucR family transcriptional regulator n=1 Tax=Streptomyces sp. NPDC002793 TaxID=3154432 RepID=UPI003318BEAA